MYRINQSSSNDAEYKIRNKSILKAIWNNRAIKHVADELLIRLKPWSVVTQAGREATGADLLKAQSHDRISGAANVSVDSCFAKIQRAPGTVYRWYNFLTGDHFYTDDPLGELAKGGGYVFEGARFRLFAAGTTNTIPLFRWFSNENRHHFCTADLNEDLAFQARYLCEGIIGNIATAELPGTVALSCWHNRENGDYFYTTDPSGEEVSAAGYVFEKTIGFVDKHGGTDFSSRGVFGQQWPARRPCADTLH